MATSFNFAPAPRTMRLAPPVVRTRALDHLPPLPEWSPWPAPPIADLKRSNVWVAPTVQTWAPPSAVLWLPPIVEAPVRRGWLRAALTTFGVALTTFTITLALLLQF